MKLLFYKNVGITSKGRDARHEHNNYYDRSLKNLTDDT